MSVIPNNSSHRSYHKTGETAFFVEAAGAYRSEGASEPTIVPPRRYSAPALAAAGGYMPVTEATSAEAQTVSPPGTYLPPGASAPIADPGGAYSAAGASAPTPDPAGTYSSPYALDRLFLIPNNTAPTSSVLSFESATAVANYFGVKSSEAALANKFFAGYSDAPATMLISRYCLEGERPHLFGGNISNLTRSQLDGISGSLSIAFQGYTYSGSINLSGQSFFGAAGAIQAALNSNLQVAAVTAGSSIAPVSVSFTGSVDGILLTVISVSSGSIELGAQFSGPGVPAGAHIVVQCDGTPGGPGVYALYAPIKGTISSETMTESYGVLTVGSVTSGTVAVGQQVTGAGVASLTGIEDNLSGSGAGSTWLVNNAQRVAGDIAMTATPLSVTYNSVVGATANRDYFEVQPNGDFGYDYNPGSVSYMGGTAAATLGLTQASGGLNSTSSGFPTSAAAYMNNLIQNENSQFGSVQTTGTQLAREDPEYLGDLTAWARSTDGLYTFSQSTAYTRPAGSSRPTTDPAGTYSAAGTTAPTPAAPGTYIPVTGAKSSTAEITDPAGTYSLAGASAPTLAQPGYYVPTTGASYETPDDSGYYTPVRGATAERLVQAPVISGTVAGQSTPSGQTDTPFSSVTITDPNKLTSDSLSIQITGGGGTLADGAGFSGLTESPAGVYLLAGTAAAITSELDALVFTPSAFSATTTLTLTDTTSRGTSKSNPKTTVKVTNGQPVHSVSYFLAHQGTLDKSFNILDSAANITANLDQLNDRHIDAIVISDNGNVGVSIAQLSAQATAIGKLQNANLSPVLLAITDTTAHIEAGLAALVTQAGMIASITASGGPIVVSAATFVDDQPALDKIVGGFAVSDIAANIMANLGQLDDPNISAITISDNGQISASVAQLTADATAIGKLENANASPVLLAINDTAGDVQTGLSTLVQDTGEISSITNSYGPIVVSVATFLTDQPALDKIAGGFDVSDSAADLVAYLSALNADSNVAGITADIGEGTLSGAPA